MSDAPLSQRLLSGDRRALARAISLVEDDRPEGWKLVREVYPHTGKAAVVGFTGPPGSGKSTLIGAVTKLRRAAGRSVGVLSIDPSSPFTQGALLGVRRARQRRGALRVRARAVGGGALLLGPGVRIWRAERTSFGACAAVRTWRRGRHRPGGRIALE